MKDRKDKKNIKQKKSKLEKKFEIREMKKKKRQRTTSLCETSEHAEQNDENAVPIPEEKCQQNPENLLTETDIAKTIEAEKYKSTEDIVSVPDQDSNPAVELKPFYVIKKEDLKVAESKTQKQKERKKPKKEKCTFSIDEFCENYAQEDISNLNDYQLRLHRLKATKRIVEEAEDRSSFCLVEKRYPNPENKANITQKDSSCSDKIQEDNVKELRDLIYTKFETILEERTSLDLNDPIINNELENIPSEWQKIIQEAGGFKSFMSQNLKFAIVGEKLCLFSEMLNLYKSSEVKELDAFNLVYGDEEHTVENGKISTFDTEKTSDLNPEAVEYSPSSSGINLDLLDTDSISPEKKYSSEDASLYNCLTRLRQPLTSDSNLMLVDSEKEDTVDKKCQKMFVEEEFLNKLSELKLYLNGTEIRCDMLDCIQDVAFMLKTADGNKVMDYLRCSKIILQNEKKHKCQQVGASQGELVSRGVMKEDEEDMQGQIELLTKENCQLKERKEAVESQLTECLDTNTQIQNRLTIELPALERSLAELKIAKNEDCKLLRSKISTLEKEIKQWRQKFDLTVDEEKGIKKENVKLQFKINNYIVKIEDLTGKCDDYEKKLANQSTAVETCEKIVHETDDAIRRAYDAEISLLKFKKETFIKRLDQIFLEGNLKIEEFRKNKERSENDHPLFPNMAVKLTEILNQLMQYSEQIHKLRIKTEKVADDLIEKAESGTPLSELEEFNFPNLPSLPDVIKELSNVAPPANIPQMNAPNVPPMVSFPPQVPPNMMPVGARVPPTNIPQMNSPNVPPMVSFPPQVPPNMMPVGARKTLLPTPPMFGVDPTANYNVMSNNAYMSNFPQQPQHMMGNRNLFSSRPPNHQLFASGLNPSVPSVYDYQTILNVARVRGLPPPGISVPAVSKPANLQNTSNVGMENNRKAVKETNEELPFPLSPIEEDRASSKGLPVSLAATGNDMDETGSTDSYQSSTQSHRQTTTVDSSRAPKDVKNASQMSRMHSFSPIELDYCSVQTPVVELPKPQPQRVNALQKTPQKKGSYTKILERLKVGFPNIPHEALLGYLKQYRDGKGKLTGKSIDSIALGVTELVNRNNRLATPQPVPQNRPKCVLNKAIVSMARPENLPVEASSLKEHPWGKPSGAEKNGWSGNCAESTCTICLEDNALPEYSMRMECGHNFHKHCITAWLSKMSNCPICRVHLLLPEDYPSLK